MALELKRLKTRGVEPEWTGALSCGIQRWVSLVCVSQIDANVFADDQEGAIIEVHTSLTSWFMVWGAIGYDNRADLVLAEVRLNARIANSVIPFMTRVPNGILHQNNTRSHPAVHTRNLFENVWILDRRARPLNYQSYNMFWMRWEDIYGRTSPQPSIFKNWHTAGFKHGKKFSKTIFGGFTC